MSDNRSAGRFDTGLYEATKTAIIEAGAPESVAEKAAEVVANDDPNLENLGRTPEDQDAVQQGWFWLVFGSGTVHDIGLPQETDHEA